MISVECNRTWKDYLRLMLQLLPPGYAWEWGASSVGRHLLAAFSVEFERLHQFLCQIADTSITNLAGEMSGWSAPEYENLLKTKFDIDAVVTDGLQPMTCESACTAPLLDSSIVFFFLITVDDVSLVSDEVRQYLKQYKQAHTDFHVRDRNVQKINEVYAVMTCESDCEDPLYEQGFSFIRYIGDWTYSEQALKDLYDAQN